MCGGSMLECSAGVAEHWAEAHAKQALPREITIGPEERDALKAVKLT
jgi:hypothetical protein